MILEDLNFKEYSNLRKIFVTRVDSVEFIESKGKDFIVELNSEEFKIALIQSLKNFKLYNSNSSEIENLEVRIMNVKLNSTVFVFDSESEVSIIYSIYKEKNLIDEINIISQGKVNQGDELLTYNRMRKAIELAMKNNIQKFIYYYSLKKVNQ